MTVQRIRADMALSRNQKAEVWKPELETDLANFIVPLTLTLLRHFPKTFLAPLPVQIQNINQFTPL
jgi:hypothetical protein